MNAIDQNRLLQMRAAIVSQNQALQRAAGLESQAPSSFTQSLSDAVQAVNAQQAKASEISAAYERIAHPATVAIVGARSDGSATLLRRRAEPA